MGHKGLMAGHGGLPVGHGGLMAGLPAALGFARGRETDVLPVVPPGNCF